MLVDLVEVLTEGEMKNLADELPPSGTSEEIKFVAALVACCLHALQPAAFSKLVVSDLEKMAKQRSIDSERLEQLRKQRDFFALGKELVEQLMARPEAEQTTPYQRVDWRRVEDYLLLFRRHLRRPPVMEQPKLMPRAEEIKQAFDAEEARRAVSRALSPGDIFVRLCRAISIISGGFLLGSGFSHGSILFSILGTVVGFAAFAFNEAMIRREA